MGLFDFLSSKKEQQPQDESKLVKEDFKVLGAYYHPNEIKRLQTPNPEYKKSAKTLLAEGKVNQRIYRYNYVTKPVTIAVDDGSVYRKGALKVIIAGQHIGYISDQDRDHVKSILDTKSVKYVTASIIGGGHKAVLESGKVLTFDNEVKISLRIAYA